MPHCPSLPHCASLCLTLPAAEHFYQVDASLLPPSNIFHLSRCLCYCCFLTPLPLALPSTRPQLLLPSLLLPQQHSSPPQLPLLLLLPHSASVPQSAALPALAQPQLALASFSSTSAAAKGAQLVHISMLAQTGCTPGPRERHTERHAETHTHRDTERHAERHAERHPERHADRHADRHTEGKKR